MIILVFFVIILSVLIAAVAIPQLISLAKRKHLYDMPNARKVHKLPIPRIGGLAFLPAMLFSCTIVAVMGSRFVNNTLWLDAIPQHFIAYIGGATMLYFIGMYDDIVGTTYKVKFIVQIIASMLLCISGLWVADLHGLFFLHQLPFWVGMPLTLLIVVYITNAMNLIDGIDGLASGLSIISLSVIGTVCCVQGAMLHALVAFSMIGAIATFFYFNVFDAKRKIFMGDGGSLTVGFSISFLLLHFWQIDYDPNPEPVISNMYIVVTSTLVIPCFDVIRVFASRIRDGRNPFMPDKNHIHHKLMRSGIGPRATMLTILCISILIIGINYLLVILTEPTLIVLADILFYVLMHGIINYFIRKKESAANIEYSREY